MQLEDDVAVPTVVAPGEPESPLTAEQVLAPFVVASPDGHNHWGSSSIHRQAMDRSGASVPWVTADMVKDVLAERDTAIFANLGEWGAGAPRPAVVSDLTTLKRDIEAMPDRPLAILDSPECRHFFPRRPPVLDVNQTSEDGKPPLLTFSREGVELFRVTPEGQFVLGPSLTNDRAAVLFCEAVDAIRRGEATRMRGPSPLSASWGAMYSLQEGRRAAENLLRRCDYEVDSLPYGREVTDLIRFANESGRDLAVSLPRPATDKDLDEMSDYLRGLLRGDPPVRPDLCVGDDR